MKVEVNGQEIATTDTGFLTNIEDWTEDVASAIAQQEGIELTQKHWDVINYCLLYTSPSPRDSCASRMPSSA